VKPANKLIHESYNIKNL